MAWGLRRNGDAAFTLIELLVVIVILAILMAIAVPSYLGQQRKAQDAAAKSDLAISFRSALGTGGDATTDFTSGATLIAALGESEPGFQFVEGDSFGDTITQPLGRIVVDSGASSEDWLVAYRRSQSDEVFRVEGGPGSTPLITQLSERIVFMSTRNGNFDIYTADADGSNEVRLTTSSDDESTPRWSPSKQKIIYVRSVAGPLSQVWTMNADGSGQQLLLSGATHRFNPSYSSNGKLVTYAAGAAGDYDIYVVSADGSNPVALTSGTDANQISHFSPDNSEIVFYSTRSGGGDIYKINTDGTGLLRLTTDPASDQSPAWSVDGTKIAYHNNAGGDYNIMVMNADGSGVPTNLTSDYAGADVNPTFSESGTRILFSSARDGNVETYSMNLDGSNKTRLSGNGATDNFVDD